MSRKFLTCLGLIILAAFLLAGCGGGGGGGTGNAVSPGTGSVTVQVEWPDKTIPVDTEFFTIDIYNPVTGEQVVSTTRIDYPTVSVIIGNVPVGVRSIVVLAHNVSGDILACGSRNLTVREGNNGTVDMELQLGNGTWSIIAPQTVPNNNNMITRGVDAVTVTPVVLRSYVSVTNPDSNLHQLTDLGPGGATQVMNYTYGNPPSDPVETALESRGTGSYYRGWLNIIEGHENGSYDFDINGSEIKHIEYTGGYCPEIDIYSPDYGSYHDLSSDITVSWDSLGSGYVYMVAAHHEADSSVGASPYDYYWSSYDMRDISFSNPGLLYDKINSLPSDTSVTIPAGTFPEGTSQIEIEVLAFNKDAMRITRTGVNSAGTFVLPMSQKQVTINPVTWKNFHHDPELTGNSYYSGPAYPGHVWTYHTGTGDMVQSSPAIDSDGTVYIGSVDYGIYSIDKDGIPNWKYVTGGVVNSSPAIGTDGNIYCGSNDGYLYCLDRDGSLKWSYQLNGEPLFSSPIIGPDGSIFIDSANYSTTSNELYMLNSDGSFNWSYQIPASEYIANTPCLSSEGVLYHSGSDGKLYAFQVYTRGSRNRSPSFLWKYDSGGHPTQSSPVISPEGYILYAAYGQMFAINPQTHLPEWQFIPESNINTTPSVDQQHFIRFGADNGIIYGLFPDGVVDWSYDAGSAVNSSPAADSTGTIYLGTNSGEMLSINSSGTLNWKYNTGNSIYSSPAITSDGGVVFGCNNHDVIKLGNAPIIYSISPNTGTEGTALTICGGNFGMLQGSSTISFNGTGAGPATVWAGNMIIVNVPAGATTGPVTVTVNGHPSNGINFTVGSATYYVNGAAGDDDNDGSQAYPFKSITHALSVCQPESFPGKTGRPASGDEVRVAQGTYNVSITGESFPLNVPSGTSLKGGYNSDFSQRDYANYITVINATEIAGVLEFNNTAHNPNLDGFIVTGGAAYNGGGILCYSSSPTITNCTITGNTARLGGGISCYSSSSPTISNCTITGNTADSGTGGGGIGCYDSSPTISNCTITGNTASSGNGGAIYLNTGTVTIYNCAFTGNAAPSYGAGGALYATSGTLYITNCTIDNNTAPTGGGIFLGDGGNATITNTIVSNNYGTQNTGGLYGGSTDCTLQITYSDFYNNALADAYNAITSEAGGIGNFNAWGWNGTGCRIYDPLFVDAGNGNFHLQGTSLLIDQGDPSYSGYLLDGGWETQAGIPDTTPVDIGYHYQFYLTP
ncbi:MAG: PQQ-binding-like beta-propeller repeat protein [Chloroflexi bacterium]|nr:PQQ-binding-like beta-propeller repeat protein [Chloroflexota bacterium]